LSEDMACASNIAVIAASSWMATLKEGRKTKTRYLRVVGAAKFASRHPRAKPLYLSRQRQKRVN
jgi:hypothetical protein